MSESWESVSRRKKAEQASRIPKEWLVTNEVLARARKPRASLIDIPATCGILTEREIDITEKYDATALSAEIKVGNLKCIDVARAFCKRAAIAHQLVNCLTEIFFDQALKRAEALDAHLAQGKPPLSLLHGVPISLKDSFRIPGYDSSIGYAALAFNPARSPSTLVEILIDAGAILYCKTNVPQTLMALDTHNNVFGRTLNPSNTELTAGGSSGGEGALIGLRGSVLGVGTDVGGSIRIPAMCNGLYGIKPSFQRIPTGGQQSNVADAMGKLALPPSAGPSATSMRDCELFMKAVSHGKPWEKDIDVVPGTWEALDTCNEKGLVVGLIKTDGVVEPLPPIRSLLDEVATRLRSTGIIVVDMDTSPLFSKCNFLANVLFGVDGANHIFDTLEKSQEPISPWLSTRLRRKEPKSLEEVRAAQAKREMLQKQFLKLWNNSPEGPKIDVLITPVAPHPVPEVERWNGVGYTSSFVLLDYPAGTLPIRHFTIDDTKGEVSAAKPLSSWDNTNRQLWTKVDRSVYIGSPLSIQVISPKLQERILCNAMGIIEAALKSDSNNLHILAASRL